MNDAIVVLLVVAAVPYRARISPGCQMPEAVGRAGRRRPDRAGDRRRGGAGRCARVALPSAGLYPLAAVGLTVLAYAVGAIAHVSGFIAIYVAGIVLGNARLPHRQAILGFADGLGMARPDRTVRPARTAGLAAPTGPRRDTRPDRRRDPAVRRPAGLGRAERHAAAHAVAGPGVPVLGRPARRGTDRAGHRPAVESLPGVEELFDVVFVVVVIFTIVQGSTLPPVARWLRVTAAKPADRAAGGDRAAGPACEPTCWNSTSRRRKLNGVHLTNYGSRLVLCDDCVPRRQGFAPDRDPAQIVDACASSQQEVRDATADRRRRREPPWPARAMDSGAYPGAAPSPFPASPP